MLAFWDLWFPGTWNHISRDCMTNRKEVTGTTHFPLYIDSCFHLGEWDQEANSSHITQDKGRWPCGTIQDSAMTHDTTLTEEQERLKGWGTWRETSTRTGTHHSDTGLVLSLSSHHTVEVCTCRQRSLRHAYATNHRPWCPKWYAAWDCTLLLTIPKRVKQ